jgi:hypothetical protein
MRHRHGVEVLYSLIAPPARMPLLLVSRQVTLYSPAVNAFVVVQVTQPPHASAPAAWSAPPIALVVLLVTTRLLPMPHVLDS